MMESILTTAEAHGHAHAPPESRRPGPTHHLPSASGAGTHHAAPFPHVDPPRHAHGKSHGWSEAFSYPFIQRAILAGLLAGGICAWLGVFILLRRMVFMGVALAQVASGGVALGVFMDWPPAPTAMLATLGASILAGMTRLKGRLTTEAHLGVTYLLAGGAAILFIAKSGRGEAEQLEMLNGNLLIVGPGLLWQLAAAALLIGVFHVLGNRSLISVGFAPVSASVEGLNVLAWDLVFFLALGGGIGVSIQGCGLLLVFGYLVIPPACGLLCRLRMPGVFLVAQVCQALGTVAGIWLAYERDTPAGPTIVLTMLAFLALTALLAHRR